jgi:hypothetical protein
MKTSSVTRPQFIFASLHHVLPDTTSAGSNRDGLLKQHYSIAMVC